MLLICLLRCLIPRKLEVSLLHTVLPSHPTHIHHSGHLTEEVCRSERYFASKIYPCIPAPAIATIAWEDGTGVRQFPPALQLTSVLVIPSAPCMQGEGSAVNWKRPTSSCRLSLVFIIYIEQDNLPGHSCKASASLLGKGFAGNCCQEAPKVLCGKRRRLSCSSKDTGIPYQPLNLNMLTLTLLATQLNPGNICVGADSLGCSWMHHDNLWELLVCLSEIWIKKKKK